MVIDAWDKKKSNILRFVNHNRINPNCYMECDTQNLPSPFLKSKRVIKCGEFLSFDYGIKDDNGS